jgi:hypothetical protein
MKIPQHQIPTDVRRKAARHLESLRGTRMGRGAEHARLSQEVCPIYRPDISGVAYYEFTVELHSESARRVMTAPALASGLLPPSASPTPSASGATNEDAGAQGFIIVSAGEHDFPIPHWSLERPPVSAQLQALAKARGRTVARIYKLDALAYLAEDEGGQEATRLGQAPSWIEGAPEDLRPFHGHISSAIARPGGEKDDASIAGSAHQVKLVARGEPPPQLRLVNPSSWPKMKERYAARFGPFLEELKNKAAGSWEIEKTIAKFGEGVAVGEAHRVPLLHPEAIVELTGEGAGAVEFHMREKSSGPPGLELHARKPSREREGGFEVHITYPEGVRERLRYFVISKDMPSNIRGQREFADSTNEEC